MKVALIADTHFGKKSDAQNILDYFEKFYSKIFFPYLDKNNIKTVIHLGDTFDRRKFVNYITLSRTKGMFLDPLRERGIDAHFLIGNHDTPYQALTSFHSPGLVMKEYPFQQYDKPTYVDFAGLSILFLPWITEETRNASLAAVTERRAAMIMGHLEINGTIMESGRECDFGFDQSVFQSYTVLSGHFHHRAKYGNIQYLGCPYEMTWADYNNEKGFHVLDTETLQIEFVPNPYKLFQRIEYDDRERIPKISPTLLEGAYVKVVVKHKSNPYEFDKFLEKVNKAKTANVMVTEEMLLEHSEETDFDIDDTLTFMNKHIDAMESLNVDRSKLTNLIADLYKQANELEL